MRTRQHHDSRWIAAGAATGVLAALAFVMWALPAPVDAVLAGAAAFACSAWFSRVGA